MPRWTSQTRPSSSVATRYLPRRPRAITVRPRSLAANVVATPPRSRRSRTSTATTRRPTSSGARPRTTVSTSGSSGTVLAERASEAGERVEIERLGARRRRDAGALENRSRRRAARGRERGERVAQHLPALTERRTHDVAKHAGVAHVDARRDRPVDVDDRRVDVRPGEEAAPRDAERDAHLRVRLQQHGGHPVVRAARPRHETGRHLALEHHDGAREARAQVEEPEEDR